jgi:hypothetical protein
MILEINLVTLVLGMMPLFIAIFGAIWVLVKQLVFKPLNQMADDLREMKESFVDHQTRVSILELKVEVLEQHSKEE